jgi:hypothetical protein
MRNVGEFQFFDTIRPDLPKHSSRWRAFHPAPKAVVSADRDGGSTRGESQTRIPANRISGTLSNRTCSKANAMNNKV